MNKNTLLILFIIVIGASIISYTVKTLNIDNNNQLSHSNDASKQPEKGPQGGKLLTEDNFALEITLFETGIPPEYRLYSYFDGKPVKPEDVSVVIKLSRLDGQIDTFNFTPQEDYLRGDGVVTEPHSFDVDVEAKYQGKTYHWSFDNYEGRSTISDTVAKASGIEIERVESKLISEELSLTGRIEVDPNRLSQVRGRFPGVVKKIYREQGQQVKRGDVLAEIQSNESLQTYQLKAPISGTIIHRDIQPGETTNDNPLFIIADLSKVWAELDIFDKDMGLVKNGQDVSIETLSGATTVGKIDWLSPMTAHASQSIQARVIITNPDMLFRPGQYIRGRVTIANHQVQLAVRKSAIQSFRDFKVVYAKVGNTYEVRMLEQGRANREWVEILDGIKPGTEYVTQNSYLIKADIEKSGASHDH